ncbi:MAG: proline--tRNA ligase [Armatimonadetes bacterium]|jgi:prolyl-tRNA synthetase|nr:proline--tRNA ligase [Armatimonadota bacterium]
MVVSSESERFIADINTDFPEWYQDVVRKADLAESSPVAGCMTIKPYGYALWENMVRILDDAFKESGHQNLYFPALIPESYLQREAEHVEGFAPECAYVTHGGGKELEERLVFRPTSETIIWQTYARWIESYRDLPLLYNQWANVMRWEMRPRLFLRTREFLWQEGHTAHATQEDAIRETLQMVGIYRTFVEESLALPVYMGEKSAAERFAGAVNTYAIEAMMKDRKAIQAGTSHFLGQNFAKAFDVTFQNERGEREYVWGTSWGVSTRLVGTVVMGHGDEKGLSLPPRVAPIQVVIVPIYREDSKDRVMSAAAQIAADCRRDGIRVKVDERDQLKPGFKFNDWEMRGVPLRMELGPKDLDKDQCVVAERVTGQKEPMPLSGLADTLARKLGETQRAMYAAAEVFRAANTHDVDDYGDLTTLMDQGAFVRAHWCEGPECEAKIKADTTATIRCIPEELRGPGKCVVCGADAPGRVIVAKAY